MCVAELKCAGNGWCAGGGRSCPAIRQYGGMYGPGDEGGPCKYTVNNINIIQFMTLCCNPM